MRKFILIICAALLFAGCAASDNNNTQQLNTAISAVNSESKISADYMLEISFGGSVLYYSAGSANWDKAEKTGNLQFKQTHLGAASEIKSFFTPKSMINITNGKVYEYNRNAETLLSVFPCFAVPAPQGKVTLGKNSIGDTYKFTRTDGKELLKSLIGGDIYSLATAITKPQRDKTRYGEVECTYTLKDGGLNSCRFEFDVTLYDTPLASAAGLPDESKYTLNLHISAKVTYKATGAGVKVEKYSTPDELLD